MIYTSNDSLFNGEELKDQKTKKEMRTGADQSIDLFAA